MSDTAQQDPNRGSGKDGQFLGEDLAKVVRVSSELATLGGGKRLDDMAAEALLSERMVSAMGREDSIAGVATTGRDLAEVIIDALPDELITAEVLQSLDLRPYLKALDGKTIVHRTGDYRGKTILISASTDTQQAHTADVLASIDKSIHEAVSAFTVNSTLTESERKKQVADAVAYRDDQAGIVNAQKPEVQAALAGTGPTWSPTMVASAMNNYGFPEDELRAMVTGDLLSYDQLVDEEAKMNQSLGGGYFPVDVAASPSMVHDVGHATRRDKVTTLNTLDALNYIHTLPPSEVAKMQIKLAAGGYFDRTTAGSAYVEGDSFDPATMEAWKLLLTDSVRENKPVPNVLGTNVRDYRERVRQARMKALPQMDQSMNNINADDYARQIIGRRLTTEEHQALNSFVLNLRTQRAGYVAGASDNTADGPLQGDSGYTGEDIAKQVITTHSWEANQMAQQERMYKLNKMMGG